MYRQFRAATLAVPGVVVAVVAFVELGISGGGTRACEVRRAAATHCPLWHALDVVGLLALLLGVGLTVAGIVVAVRNGRRRAPAAPPGWYLPGPGVPLRWWDGHQWGPWQGPPPHQARWVDPHAPYHQPGGARPPHP